MIRFSCKHCGQKIRVPEAGAGRKGKCPKCKNIVLVPQVEDTTPVASRTELSASEIISGDSILDSRRFDITQESKAAGDGTAKGTASDKAVGELQRLQGSLRRVELEPLPERKLPWYIDIVIYPTSKAGLTILGIFIGVPLLMEAFVQALFLLTGVFPPFFVFAVFFLVISLLINVVIRLYRYWYLSECIRDSSEGQIRAPETVASTPGLWELISIYLKIFVCIIVLSAPMYFYLLKSKEIERSFGAVFGFTLFFFWTMVTEVGRSGITFHILLFLAVFFFPMTLLSVVMFDSYRGLNPLLILSSIYSTIAPYCGMVLLLCVLWLPVVLIRKFIVTQVVSFQSSLFLYLPRAVSIYLMLVGAHLLGGFYWRYQEKLNWDV
jgi:phage FluMu protein Com